jgi:hypothetical protein
MEMLTNGLVRRVVEITIPMLIENKDHDDFELISGSMIKGIL